jgi:hypothetical protein
MINHVHCEEQELSDLTSKNQQTTGNPQAYAHALEPSSVHQRCCSRIYITIQGKGIRNMFYPVIKREQFIFLIKDSIPVIRNQEALLDS